MTKIPSLSMNPAEARLQHLTRRHFLRDCQVGLGGIALTTLGAGKLSATEGPENERRTGAHEANDQTAETQERKR